MEEKKRRIVLSKEAKSSVSLPPDLLTGLRMFCKLRGLTQAQVVTDAIIGYISILGSSTECPPKKSPVVILDCN